MLQVWQHVKSNMVFPRSKSLLNVPIALARQQAQPTVRPLMSNVFFKEGIEVIVM